MSLTNEDLNKIRKIVRSENESIIIRLDNLEMRIKLIELDCQHFRKEFERVKESLAQLKKMEDEDSKAFFTDLIKLEKRVAKLEVKIA